MPYKVIESVLNSLLPFPYSNLTTIANTKTLMATKTAFRLPTALRRLFHHRTTKSRVLDDSDGSLLVQRAAAVARVPKGHMAVYVGPELRRYVIPLKLLSSPELKELLASAAEEFGYEVEGGLKLPCEEDEFEEILMQLQRKKVAR